MGMTGGPQGFYLNLQANRALPYCASEAETEMNLSIRRLWDTLCKLIQNAISNKK